jgi:predicted esterase
MQDKTKVKSVVKGIVLVVMLVLLLTSVSATLPAQSSTGDFYRVNGEIRGHPYSLYLPDDWNGDLVLLVHGTLPDWVQYNFEALAPELVSLGYGVGYSLLAGGREAEGTALKEITINTRIVQAQFTAEFGKPNRTYLFGFSRGATNITNLVESSSVRYDGVLSVCGGNAGSKVALDYLFTARVLFDYYFPGVLPDEPMTSNADLDSYADDILPDIIDAILARPDLAMDMADVDQYKLPYVDFPDLIGGIVWSLAIPVTDASTLVASAGGNFFDNMDVVYTGSTDDKALNAGIARFQAEPRAKNYFQTWGQPSGKINATPFLALHTSRDPIVPDHFHNEKYQQLVESTGNGEYFLRRVIDRSGHCFFSNEELMHNFLDLVGWVETGVRPSG